VELFFSEKNYSAARHAELMASTAMRLVIIVARADASYVLFGGFHSEASLPLSFFET
jgi:hypothetical protein